jgi:hypothetical protein
MSGTNPGAAPPGNHTCPGCAVSDPGGGGIPPELSLLLQFLHDRRREEGAHHDHEAAMAPQDEGLRAAVENVLTSYGNVLKARAAAVEAVAVLFRR